MSEPQITHSEPQTDLRKQIQAVLDRHTKIYGVNHFTEAVLEVCSVCQREWPCDAHTLATALLEAIGKLEWYADSNNWQGGMPMYHHFVPDTEFGPEENEMRADMGDAARSALTTIAAKLKEANDAR